MKGPGSTVTILILLWITAFDIFIISSLFTASKIRTLDFFIASWIFFTISSIGCSISDKVKYVDEYLISFCIKLSTQDVFIGVLGSFPASEFSNKTPFTNIVLLTTILPESG